MEYDVYYYDNGVFYKNGVKMEKNKEKINICPFCGSDNIECIETSCGVTDNNSKIKYSCVCHNCKITSPLFNSRQEAIEYWNKSKKEKNGYIKYDYDNFISYCENCGSIVDSGTDIYCSHCGTKLQINAEEEQKFMDNYDATYTHPYGWPLNKIQIVNSVGRPVYIEKLNGEFCWKIVGKIEINRDGYIIKFTDGSCHLFHELNVYDPVNIVRQELYPPIPSMKK